MGIPRNWDKKSHLYYNYDRIPQNIISPSVKKNLFENSSKKFSITATKIIELHLKGLPKTQNIQMRRTSQVKEEIIEDQVLQKIHMLLIFWFTKAN